MLFGGGTLAGAVEVDEAHALSDPQGLAFMIFDVFVVGGFVIGD